MSETFLIGHTTLGNKPSDLELMLDARYYPKPNIEVGFKLTITISRKFFI